MTELEICRKIYQLLTAGGEQSEVYRRLFLRDVLKATTFIKDEVKTLEVKREYRVDGHRIDLVIETIKRFIPIEVKISADDKPAQCGDYFKSARDMTAPSVETRVYCLTPNRQRPVGNFNIIQNSAVDSGEGVVLISFGDEILTWLNDCLGATELEIFRDSIVKLIGEVEDIARVVEITDAETQEEYHLVMLEIFEALDSRIDDKFCAKFKLNKIPPADKIWNGIFSWSGFDSLGAYQLRLDDYYNNPQGSSPGIYFRYGGDDWNSKGFELWFFVGIDDGNADGLHTGWLVFDLKRRQCADKLPAKVLGEAKRFFRIPLTSDRGVILRRRLAASNDGGELHFNKKNAAVESLMDSKNFNAAIDFMMRRIENMASNLK